MIVEELSVSESRLRLELSEVARRTYAAGYAAATDGNVSARLGPHYLISPSGCCLGELQPEDLLEVDRDGRVVPGTRAGRPTSEYRMHLAVYEEREDVSAVLHAHPPTAIAFTVAGESLSECVIPEVVVGLGTVLTLPYTTPTTEETAQMVRRNVRRRDALLLEHHGTVTVGKSIKDAFYKLDKLEHMAKILFTAKQLGRVIPLPADEVERLLGMREAHGYPPLIP